MVGGNDPQEGRIYIFSIFTFFIPLFNNEPNNENHLSTSTSTTTTTTTTKSREIEIKERASKSIVF